LGWGVRTITFIDNGKISYSNPVRQSLYNFEDCLNGGKLKAIAAAASLKVIFPEMNATGVNLTIPMPGHPATSDAESSYEKLLSLILAHDVIFLGTDSRESRWLPTLLSQVHGKLVINAALGFDTFLVMRHGLYSASESAKPRLGCYFCNDMVAPQDSLTNRTLDQQCTVTRPGASTLAAAVAVELWVSILQHPDGPLAPADESKQVGDVTPTPFGLVPHQIRGFLTHFSNLLVLSNAYEKCAACSPKILDEYKKRKFEFLKDAFNHPKYLEELSGLADLHKEAAVDMNWIEEDVDDM